MIKTLPPLVLLFLCCLGASASDADPCEVQRRAHEACQNPKVGDWGGGSCDDAGEVLKACVQGRPRPSSSARTPENSSVPPSSDYAGFDIRWTSRGASNFWQWMEASNGPCGTAGIGVVAALRVDSLLVDTPPSGATIDWVANIQTSTAPQVRVFYGQTGSGASEAARIAGEDDSTAEKVGEAHDCVLANSGSYLNAFHGWLGENWRECTTCIREIKNSPELFRNPYK